MLKYLWIGILSIGVCAAEEIVSYNGKLVPKSSLPNPVEWHEKEKAADTCATDKAVAAEVGKPACVQ